MNLRFRHAGALALVLATACTDRPGAVEPGLTPPPPSDVLAALECTAQVAAGTLQCQTPAPGSISRDLIVGGQGVYVQLRSSNVSYDTVTGVFAADLTVQNLLGQPVGTEDGTTPSGVRIFFHELPTATSGSGVVEVANPDGDGAFTGSAQPFFLYPEILAPFEHTAPRRWEWSVPRSVGSFSFQVYVHAGTPNELGVLRWTQERGEMVARHVNAVWGSGPNDVWAAGSQTLMYWNGQKWTVVPAGFDSNVDALWGSGSDDVWAVGAQLIRRFNGRRWSAVTPPVNENFSDVWGSGPNDVYVTGGAFGWVLRWDGAQWDTVFAPASGRTFGSAWGTGPDNVYLAGAQWVSAKRAYDGFVMHWDGQAWTTTTFPDRTISELWGSGPSDIHAVGSTIFRFDGAQWTEVAPPGGVSRYLTTVWGSGPNDVWAAGTPAGSAAVYHFDGTQWSLVETGAKQGARAVWGTGPDNVFLTGSFGMVLRRTGGLWTEMVAGNRVESFMNVWAAGEDDAYAVTCEGQILRNSGSGWQVVHQEQGSCFRGVWGAGGEIFVSGTGNQGTAVVLRWTGSAWERRDVPGTRDLPDLWGFGPDDVYAAGHTENPGQLPVVVHWDGTSWSHVPMNDVVPYGMLHGIWGSGPNDLWAVGTTVLHYDGTMWRQVSGYNWYRDVYNDVWGTGPGGTIYIVGSEIVHGQENAWTSYRPTPGWYARGVWGSAHSDVYVVGTWPLHFNGAHWVELNFGASTMMWGVHGL